ncbi:quinone oxidoreductase [Serratia liquefaciens]|uniref:quinone oxidoreductase family protein n=1 Tax=Serratia liquefaciens TaxID=614 RepID=UPI00101E9BAE|nr:quinone oxidoreductase [Serratia liquefaciens]MBI6161156.1 quinone oxidoreductase [Serratia liquefaciens]RYM75273.1 alcohol dehydrogenase [Serratia liquefaciens]RYM80293.1 alcohol dehydrogenase [Serratia liquefaciens]
MQALAFEQFGGPDVLEYLELPTPAVPAGAVQVRMGAAGLNFADIYRRKGNYVLHGNPPHIGGYEGVGTIIALGEGVQGWQLGERIGFADVPFCHATRINVPVEHALRLPQALSDVEAASILLQGLTAQYLINDSVQVKAGDRALVHAAAGGVGQILTRMLVARGVQVYAVVSSAHKQQIALNNGAVAAFTYQQDWVTQIAALTDGGVEYGFDSVGITLQQSIDALRPGGRVVTFGMAGGEAPAISAYQLMMDSKGVVGGDLWTYLNNAEARRTRAERLFSSWQNGEFAIPYIETFPLKEGAAAHRRLEDRSFAGKIVLLNDSDPRS